MMHLTRPFKALCVVGQFNTEGMLSCHEKSVGPKCAPTPKQGALFGQEAEGKKAEGRETK